MEIDPLKVKAI